MIKSNLTSSVLRISFLLAASFSLTIANAQNTYPNRSIQTIMPLQAGSGVDLLFRPIAQKMGENLGQAITIENIPGGAGLIGTTKVAQSPAEGYVLGAFNDSILTMLPNLYKKIDYDPVQSFVPISELAAITFVLVANPSFPGNTAADLVRIAKENPGKIDYASGGNGSPQHIGMEIFRQSTGAPIVHIPYRGAAAAATDVMAGQVPVMLSALSVVLPHIRAGKLKVLGIASKTRSPLLPNAPTINESVKGYEFSTWGALLAPKGTPPAVIDKLNESLATALKDPKLREQLISQGFELAPLGPDHLKTMIAQGLVRMKKVIKDGGIQPD
ncbi:tripartite tricarboxylate transporter substrate binding protein [Polynucleobacter sp. 15G-AUS-farblos]|uniref:Bug family tripartite tricarboxylate transporter substrate binding protein n=1 Tax=Polynucleobacter sp. 15G-AUS-farblos TaxID=2689094 RepID=UPI001C0D795B|nr:tripartite tricarboxylate transporter substrate binding protein [Polynucleobacter sp. 15G-AUS-farblos]MBU3583465.1 tripartite tricarboxylate transporter substrate binding protein [Polynucleobacter sp. 15G-AUS-farblos]